MIKILHVKSNYSILYIHTRQKRVFLYNNLENIPSKGMTYGDEQFSNGPDGETFISNSTATDRSYELFVFLKDNKVIGHWLLPNEHPIFEITSAVLKSSPRFEIVE